LGITCHTNAASRRLPHDLSSAALTDEGSDTECFVVAVNDTPEGYGYPPEVRFEIAEQDLRGYWRAADFLNFTNADVSAAARIWHYGGTAGSHLLALLRRLNIPVVTHLHEAVPTRNPGGKSLVTGSPAGGCGDRPRLFGSVQPDPLALATRRVLLRIATG